MYWTGGREDKPCYDSFFCGLNFIKVVFCAKWFLDFFFFPGAKEWFRFKNLDLKLFAGLFAPSSNFQTHWAVAPVAWRRNRGVWGSAHDFHVSFLSYAEEREVNDHPVPLFPKRQGR